MNLRIKQTLSSIRQKKNLKDYGDKVPPEHKSKIEDALRELKAAIETGKFDDMKKAIDTLEQASYKMAEAMYSGVAGGPGGPGPGGPGSYQAPPPGPSGPAAPPPPPGDDVVDAEFKSSDI